MKYRMLNRAGIEVSEIGMGCEGFVGKSFAEVEALVDRMEQAGINCIDLYTPDPEVRSNLGRALRGRREKFVLQAHVCTIWKDGQYKRTRNIEEIKSGFADQLKRLETTYLEIGMIHYVDSMSDWEDCAQGAVMDYVRSLKAEGMIGAIGLSSHNPEVALAAVESGLIDVLMFSVNPCYDLLPANEDVDVLFDENTYAQARLNMEPMRERLYEACEQRGVGITVMKAFAGGDLLSDERSPAGKGLTVHQCIQYALDRPGVACVLVGAKSMQDLEESISFETATQEQRNYASALAQMPKVSWQGHCMYCGHCAPCPIGISVAEVTKLLNLTLAQREVPETVREHYALLTHHASECVQCGACETRCPFAVSIQDNMKQASEIFGY